MVRSLDATVIVPTFGRVAEALALARDLETLDPQPLRVIFVFQVAEELIEWKGLNTSQKAHGVLCSSQGASHARNMGAQVAGTEFLAFLDDDCQPINRNWLAELLLPLDGEGVALSTGPVYGWTAYSSLFKKSKHAYMLATNLLIPWGNPESRLSGNCHTIAGGNFAVRRELYVANDGFSTSFGSPSLHEETEFAIRVARVAKKKIWFTASAPVFHRQRNEGGMRFESTTLSDEFIVSQKALLMKLVGNWTLRDRALFALYSALRRIRSKARLCFLARDGVDG